MVRKKSGAVRTSTHPPSKNGSSVVVVPPTAPEAAPEPSAPLALPVAAPAPAWWPEAPPPRSAPVAPVAVPEPLTVEVALNAADAAVIRSLAEEEYRTPAQQVGYVVHLWLGLHRKVGATQATTPQPVPSNGHASPSPVPSPPATPPPGDVPALLPVWHDGSKGGCGKVGLLFARRIRPGDVIGPADVFNPDGTRLTSGPLLCGAEIAPGRRCGQPMSPNNWSFED
jgi:hypothetical protein